MDQTDRAANEALTKLFARVSGSHVDPGWLARELLAADVITASSEEFANSPYQGKAERLRRVLVDVRGNGREGTFQELVRILQSNKAYSWLGQELVDEYVRAGGLWTKEEETTSPEPCREGHTPSLRELVAEVCTTKPHHLGVLLGIKERDLEVIEVNHRHDMDTQLLKVLQEYLNQTTEPSWQHVASVLHHMGEISMADTIAKKYDVTITEIT